MAPENKAKREFPDLRYRAEARVANLVKSADSRAIKDANRLVHELEVHRIELELQNEELRDARSELDAIYDELYVCAPVGYFTLGPYGDIEKINVTGASMLGQPRAELLGRRIANFVESESLPSFNEFLRRVMGGSRKDSCMVTLMKGGNTPIAAYIEASCAGPDSSCRAVAVEITSAEQPGRAARESEARLKLALAASEMGVWEWERDTGEIYWSPECMKIVGLDCFSPTLDTLAQLLHPEDAPRVKSVVSRALVDGKDQATECRIIRPNGEIVWIFVRGKVQYDQDGKPLGVIGIAQERDMTEWVKAEEASRALQVELRQLAAEQLAVQEAERRHVAADLHDGLGQSLTLLKLGIQEALGHMGAGVPPKAVESVKKLLPKVAGALNELRRVSTELRPSILDDLGIVTTLSWFVREFESTNLKTRIEKIIGVDENDVPQPLKIVIFRILQEAVNNAVKHADADRIEISLRNDDGALAFSIEDNGKGFEPGARAGRGDERRGIGLQSMKERAELSGGSYALTSAIGRGTSICVLWPAVKAAGDG